MYIHLAFTPPHRRRGSIPWDDLHKIFGGCQWMAKVRTKRRRQIVENFNWLSKVHVRTLQTDDRQTDGRAIAYSERETFAKN